MVSPFQTLLWRVSPFCYILLTMFGKKEEARVSNQEIRTLIGIGCLFDGNLTIPEGLTRIDGEIRGNISGKGGLILGERGSVRGDIDLERVVVYGRVQGNIKAQSLEIKAGGRVDGNVQVKELIIEKGAVYNGECKMEGGEAPTELQSSRVDMSPTGSPSS